MASTIVCTVTSGAFTRTETTTLSDSDAARMLTALKAFFTDPINLPNPTNNQAVDLWWQNIVIGQTKIAIQQQEKKTAQATSVDSIQPIVTS